VSREDDRRIETQLLPGASRRPVAAVPGLSFRCGPGRVELAASGTVTAVLHDSAPEVSYLDSAGELRVAVDGAPLAWSSPAVSVDADEVEVTRSGGLLRLVVRHTFGDGWGLRVALTNEGPDVLTLDDPVLTWRVPPDRPAWALAAGAAGSYAVLPPAGVGPVLGGVLRLGALTDADADGLHLGPVRLEPGGRYVVAWQWDFVATPRSFERGRHPDVPRRLDLLVDEVAAIAAGEDEALVTTPGLDAETVREGVELSALEPGSYGVELRSARGVTAYELRVGAPLETVLAQTAATLLDRPRTASGVVPLPDVAAALVVQRALAAGGLADPVTAEEALDLVAARLPEDGPRDGTTLAFLCGEHSRTGDPEPLDQASRAVLAAAQPVPGLGLAATELCLALLLAGRSVAPVLDHLVRLARAAGSRGPSGSLTDQAALLELAVVTMARPASEGLPRDADAVAARVAGLGDWLGAGLKGRAVSPLPVDQVAHLAAVLALLPEPVSAALGHRWGCTAHELARRGQAEVLCRWPDAPAASALAWLVLGSRPG